MRQWACFKVAISGRRKGPPGRMWHQRSESWKIMRLSGWAFRLASCSSRRRSVAGSRVWVVSGTRCNASRAAYLAWSSDGILNVAGPHQHGPTRILGSCLPRDTTVAHWRVVLGLHAWPDISFALICGTTSQTGSGQLGKSSRCVLCTALKYLSSNGKS